MIGRRVKRDFALVEPTKKLGHLFGAGVELFCKRCDQLVGIGDEIRQPRALSSQAEEQLGSERPGAGADHCARANDRFEHERSNPVARVGHEPRSAVGIELANSRHQADAALGDQVAELHAVATVLKRDGDHVPQVRFHEAVGSILIAFAGAQREPMFFFPRQLGDSPDLLDVSIERGG